MGYLTNFHYQITGINEGPKLVFLHGLMGSLANWRRVVSAFVSDYQVLVFDQRGHGRSFHPSKGFAPTDYAQDLGMILDELGWQEKIHLVGHSMGGRNALAFTHLSPERVEKLVIEDIGPEDSLSSVNKIEGYLRLVPTPFKDKRAAKHFFDREFPSLLGGDPRQGHVLSQYFYTNIESQSTDGTADWRFSKAGILSSLTEGRDSDMWTWLRALRLPTLLLRGGESADLSHEIYKQMLQSNSWIQGVEVEGAGHWIHFDQPEKFIAALKKFFTSESESLTTS